MSLEDEFTRDTRAMERIATALERLATVYEKRFDKDFPAPKVKRDAELIRADERADQYSDKLTPGWLDEAPKDAEPSRFQKRLEEQPATAKANRITEVPEGDGDKRKPS